MARENLDNLVKARQLQREAPVDDEIANLIHSGLVRLADAKNRSLGFASRFDLAYNAAHALSLAALRFAGYRSNNRYIVFQCTQHTLDLEPEKWRILEQAHRKRNVAEYEGDMQIDEQLLAALIRIADAIAERLQDRAE